MDGLNVDNNENFEQTKHIFTHVLDDIQRRKGAVYQKMVRKKAREFGVAPNRIALKNCRVLENKTIFCDVDVLEA